MAKAVLRAKLFHLTGHTIVTCFFYTQLLSLSLSYTLSMVVKNLACNESSKVTIRNSQFAIHQQASECEQSMVSQLYSCPLGYAAGRETSTVSVCVFTVIT